MNAIAGPASALVLAHLQNDFFPGGTIPVARAETVVPVVNRYVEHFRRSAAAIVIARDWHPWDHCSFFGSGGNWMRHCVIGEHGGQLHRELRVPSSATFVSLGVEADRDPVSIFEGTALNAKLRPKIRRLYLCGLEVRGTILASALDGRFLGYEVFLLEDGIRARRQREADRSTLRRAGVKFAALSDFGLARPLHFRG